MAGCTLKRELDGGRALIRVLGSFDRKGVAELTELLAREPGDVVIDFSQVQDFADVGVASLALRVGQTGRRTTIRGLRTHQLRLFRYLGMNLDDDTGAGERALDGAEAR